MDLTRRFGAPTPHDEEERLRRKRRRYLSRSDEQIKEEMDKARLSYRAGWPTLLPLPLDTILDDAKAAVHEANERLKEVESIIRAQRITHSRFHFVYRIPRNEEVQDDLSSYLTLMFTADYSADSHKIENTIVKIRSRFQNHESTENISIECLDFRAVNSLKSFPIRYDDKQTIDRWEAVEPVVLQALKAHEWISIEVLRRGLVSDENVCPPTVVITSPSAAQEKWTDKIIPALTDRITSVAPDFKIELLYGTTLLGSRRKYTTSDKVDDTSYEKDVRMGASIGLSNGGGAGTLGGPVTLEGGVACGLTNWHVVRDERVDIEVPRSTQQPLEPGNRTLETVPQQILSPSTLDHEGYLGTLQGLMKEYTNQIAAGSAYAKPEYKMKNEQFLKFEKYPRIVGNLYAGSNRRSIMVNKYATDKKTGKGKEKGKDKEKTFLFPLDWALIRLSDISKLNIIPRLPNKRLPTTSTSNLVQDKLCSQWTSFDVEKEDIRVAKYGRTTGWSLGVINSILCYINPIEDKEISEAYGFTNEKPGRCFGVINRNASEDFLDRGDSGSILVHDGSGTQLGLLFGLANSGQGLMLPLDVVFQDIKKVTGKSVISPSYIDPAQVELARYQLAD